MKSLALLTAAAAAAATLAATTHATNRPARYLDRAVVRQVTSLRRGIAWHRAKTWSYQDAAGVSRTRTEYAERHSRSAPFLRWIDRLWSHRRIAAKRYAARHPAIPHLALWMCIHSGEAGDWHNEDTGHNGHYGGMQMHWDWGYGIVGDAAHYSATEQMLAAERGYRASGYSRSWLFGQWAHPECMSLA